MKIFNSKDLKKLKCKIIIKRKEINIIGLISINFKEKT